MTGTIADNIARLDPDRHDEDVIEAAQQADVHEMVTQLPDAYETLVGPGGRPLSGGQTQRVALARAFYGSPTFVVLDEPNAYLDSDGEKRLSEAITAAKARGTTTVITTQRTSILQVADKILVLRDGCAEAFGPRDDMLARLMQSQSPSQTKPIRQNATTGAAQPFPMIRVSNEPT